MKNCWCKLFGWIAPLLLLASLAGAQVFPSRPDSGVLDQSQSLSSNDRSALEALLRRARAQGEDIAVVVLKSLDGAEPRAYATKLFNAWGLGRAKSNRGILVLVAVQDRAAELILGAGIDGAAEQAISERIMQDSMVPEFRAGRYAMGAFRGAERAAAEILRLPIEEKSAEAVALSAPPAVTTLAAEQRPPVQSEASPYAPTEHANPGALEQSGTPISGTPESGAPIVGAPKAGAPTSGAPTSTLVNVLAGLIVVAMVLVPMLVVGGLLWLGWRWLVGRRVRHCRVCKQQMQRLNEMEDDQFLGTSERLEEKLGSMNYDVWRCTACQHADKVAHSRWFSSYKHCPACQAKTLKCENRELSAASFSSTGTGEITENCQACGHHHAKQYVIARRVQSSTTSSFRSGSSGGSSRGGSSSSGGGSSRGGGASGRW